MSFMTRELSWLSARVPTRTLLEICLILTWYLGASLHSVFTRNLLAGSSLDIEPSVAVKLERGALVAAMQLLLAGITGVVVFVVWPGDSLTNVPPSRDHLREDLPQASLSLAPPLQPSGCSHAVLQGEQCSDDGRQSGRSKQTSVLRKHQAQADQEAEAPASSLAELSSPALSFPLAHVSLRWVALIAQMSRLLAIRPFVLSCALTAIANICANTALGGGRVIIVQIIKCGELVLTSLWVALLATFLHRKKRSTTAERGQQSHFSDMIWLLVSTAGIVLVVVDTLKWGDREDQKAAITGVRLRLAAVFAILGALTISLRNVLVAKENRGEAALVPFLALAIVGGSFALVAALVLRVLNGILGDGASASWEVQVIPAILASAAAHGCYNFASLIFLAMVDSAVTHAYFNAVKRAVVIVTAEVLRCQAPTGLQITGTALALVGLHYGGGKPSEELARPRNYKKIGSSTSESLSRAAVEATSSSGRTSRRRSSATAAGQTSNGRCVVTLVQKPAPSTEKAQPSSMTLLVALGACVVFWCVTSTSICRVGDDSPSSILRLFHQGNVQERRQYVASGQELLTHLDEMLSLNELPPLAEWIRKGEAKENTVYTDRYTIIAELLSAVQCQNATTFTSNLYCQRQRIEETYVSSYRRPPQGGPNFLFSDLQAATEKTLKALNDRFPLPLYRPSSSPRARPYQTSIDMLQGATRAITAGLANHENKGDPAINVGEFEIIHHILKLPVIYYCTLDCNYTEALQLAEEEISKGERVVVLSAGGGNFGDMWVGGASRVENLRAFVNHTDIPVILMPQSINWRNKDAASKHGEELQKHPNLHILARDLKSYHFLIDHPAYIPSSSARLVPDSAFAIPEQLFLGRKARRQKGPNPADDKAPDIKGLLPTIAEGTEDEVIHMMMERLPLQGSRTDIVWMKRGDAESTKYELPKLPEELKGAVALTQGDWLGGWGIAKPWSEKYPPGFTSQLRYLRFILEQQIPRLFRGIDFFTRGEVAVTDRLHGHIFLSRLHTRHVVMDNNYGKVLGYSNTWMRGLVDDPEGDAPFPRESEKVAERPVRLSRDAEAALLAATDLLKDSRIQALGAL